MSAMSATVSVMAPCYRLYPTNISLSAGSPSARSSLTPDPVQSDAESGQHRYMPFARAHPQLGLGQPLQQRGRVRGRDDAVGAALHQQDGCFDRAELDTPRGDVGQIVVGLADRALGRTPARI